MKEPFYVSIDVCATELGVKISALLSIVTFELAPPSGSGTVGSSRTLR